jgi:hypothetical protein
MRSRYKKLGSHWEGVAIALARQGQWAAALDLASRLSSSMPILEAAGIILSQEGGRDTAAQAYRLAVDKDKRKRRVGGLGCMWLEAIKPLVHLSPDATATVLKMMARVVHQFQSDGMNRRNIEEVESYIAFLSKVFGRVGSGTPSGIQRVQTAA